MASNYIIQQDKRIKLPITVCLQYQIIKNKREYSYAPFDWYGFKTINSKDKENNLWGYHVTIDSTKIQNTNYRMFKHNDILSFAIIDNQIKTGNTQYIFWWKGYYRNFATELKQLGFTMSNVPGKTNVLRFSRNDTNITIDFIIWEDIYIMEIKSKK